MESPFSRPLAEETRKLVNNIYNWAHAVSPFDGVPEPAVHWLGGYRKDALDACIHVRSLGLETCDRYHIVASLLDVMAAVVRIPGCHAGAWDLPSFESIGAWLTQITQLAREEGHSGGKKS